MIHQQEQQPETKQSIISQDGCLYPVILPEIQRQPQKCHRNNVIMIKNRNIRNKLHLNASTPLEIITSSTTNHNLTSATTQNAEHNDLDLLCSTPDFEDFFNNNNNKTTNNNNRSCSSSSSLSWAEDVDEETTRKVQMEFERMDRVLLGLEEAPENYDKEEYELWAKTFPIRFR